MDRIHINGERDFGMSFRWQRGSFTVEAAIWVPIMVFMVMGTVQIGITFFQESVKRESYSDLVQLDIVQEFYNYQIIGEIGEELLDD